MPQFRKKPVVIEAVQLTRENGLELAEWSGGQWLSLYARGDRGEDLSHVLIPTLEGDHRAEVGDFIIKGVKGEFYPCKPDIFDMTYEPAVATPTRAPSSPEGDTVAVPVMWRRRGKHRWFYRESPPPTGDDSWLPLYNKHALTPSPSGGAVVVPPSDVQVQIRLDCLAERLRIFRDAARKTQHLYDRDLLTQAADTIQHFVSRAPSPSGGAGQAMREACAKIAEEHMPPPRKAGRAPSDFTRDLMQAEENGERVAAVEIAKKIRALPVTPAEAEEGDNGWRTMDSAPRDGSLVDLWVGGKSGHRLPDCSWGEVPHTCGEDGQYCDSCPPDGPVWRDCLLHALDDEIPVMWRPSPPDPAAPPFRTALLPPGPTQP